MRTTRITLALAVAWLTVAVVAPGAAQEVLTNDSIIQLTRAKFAESVILAKIRSTPSTFDTRADALIALKRAGVSEKVLEAMLSAGQSASPTAPAAPPGGSAASPSATGPASTPPAAPATAPAASGGQATTAAPASPGVAALPAQTIPPPPREQGTIYRLVGSTRQELTAALGEVQANRAFVENKTELVLGGKQSVLRIKERQPVFLSSFSPTEAQLARLNPGENDRNLNIGSGLRVRFVNQQRKGVRNEDKVEVTSERDGQGFYRITPRQPLSPGEYAFVLIRESSGRTTGKMFDFGIDP
jgi:hypothetical protein